ncbi:GGDEF domain-containing protein [Eubacterium aggregans]|uniref:GGDEF domain-containing protein n=1 Tax=Eubacterium aggregans TaxID=81409 RepID=UPI003F3F09D6
MNNPITTRDPLTGLLDRSGFLCYVENQLKANNVAQYTIIYGNIRNFKVINEIRGTQVGDKVLIDFAEKFSSYSHLENFKQTLAAEAETTNTWESRPKTIVLKVESKPLPLEGLRNFLGEIAPDTFRIKGFLVT